MFSEQLPHYVEPRKLADQGVLISGQTTVAALPRFSDFDQSQAEAVSVALTFERDPDDGQRIVHGTVSAALVMTCQRCLEPVTCDVTAQVNLALVWTEEEISMLPERYDPWLMTDEKMTLATLLEEELLLALPLVATHEQCPTRLPEGDEPDASASDERADNPFAVLASLKGSQK